MEASGSAHHWARELRLLGHEVRLMPPHYVKPYVKRGKNDAADAEAICEAVSRPSMRFVPVKGTDQQGVLMLHRTRSLLVRQRTMLANALRSHLSEFGIVVAKGIENIAKLATIVETAGKDHLPMAAVEALSVIVGQLREWLSDAQSIPTNHPTSSPAMAETSLVVRTTATPINPCTGAPRRNLPPDIRRGRPAGAPVRNRCSQALGALGCSRQAGPVQLVYIQDQLTNFQMVRGPATNETDNYLLQRFD